MPPKWRAGCHAYNDLGLMVPRKLTRPIIEVRVCVFWKAVFLLLTRWGGAAATPFILVGVRNRRKDYAEKPQRKLLLGAVGGLSMLGSG